MSNERASSKDKKRVQKGLDVNSAVNKLGWTLVYSAAYNGQTEMVSTLIAAGANINHANKYKWTPLMIAVQQGHKEIVSRLIAAGANINQADNRGWTPLYIAARYDHKEIVSILIDAGAKINQADNNGKLFQPSAQNKTQEMIARTLSTAYILRAARLGDKKTLRAMLRSSLHPDSITDESGYTPLYIAAEYGHHEVVTILIATGADVNKTLNDQVTPLYVAAQNGHVEIVSTLIAAGANIHLPKTNGATPLCIAAEKGHIEVVHRLTSDPSFNQDRKNRLIARITKANTDKDNSISGQIPVTTTYLHETMTDGNTPLHLAAANGHKEVVELLVLTGANINQTNQIGWTPLFSSASNGHIEIVSALISAGANIIQKAQDDTTILHVASQFRQNNVVELLIANNEDCNITSMNGKTALYIAAENGFTDIIWALLLAEADPNIQANNGMTPFMVANQNGHEEVAGLLSTKGLLKIHVINAIRHGNTRQLQVLMAQLDDPNIVDMNGDSLLHVAIRYDNSQALNMLLQISTAQVYSLNANKETPLTFAIKSGSQLAKAIFAVINKPIQYIHSTDLYINYEKVLGNGSFGSVFKGRFKNRIVAVKKMILTPNISTDALKREIDAMHICRSPYVLGLIAICELNTNQPKLNVEYMDDGDLQSYLYKKQSLFGSLVCIKILIQSYHIKKQSNTPTKTNYSTLEIAWVIANGLADIHHSGCIHRDLKSQNILLSTEHYIKIADLGLTRDAYNTQTLRAGTMCWMAPEVYTSDHYDSSADIYSFGVILTELDTLNLPYHGVSISYKKFLDGICNGSLRPSLSTTCSPWYRNLVNDCLARDPKERPSASDVIDILFGQLQKKESSKESSAMQAPPVQPTRPSFTDIPSSNANFNTSLSLPRQRVPLKSTEIRCKMCQVHNSISNEFCLNCTKPLLSSEAKVKVLLKRLENAKINPVWHCSVCSEKNAARRPTCHHEISTYDKIHDLVALLQREVVPLHEIKC